MEKTIKVRCIDADAARLTKGKIYEVMNCHGQQYRGVDDYGSKFHPFKSRFEIVEEKPVEIKIPSLEALQNNMTDMINRNLCEKKPIVQTTDEWVRKYAIAGSIVESQDWMKPKTVKRKTGQSIRDKWRFNGSCSNLIDRFNRMRCEEKKFKGMHVPYLRDIVETIKMKPGEFVKLGSASYPEKLRSRSMKVIVLDEVEKYPLDDTNWNNTKDEINRILCNTYHIETPPDKKVEYHEPGFKSKWDTVVI